MGRAIEPLMLRSLKMRTTYCKCGRAMTGKKSPDEYYLLLGL